jgi:hypothetical protein
MAFRIRAADRLRAQLSEGTCDLSSKAHFGTEEVAGQTFGNGRRIRRLIFDELVQIELQGKIASALTSDGRDGLSIHAAPARRPTAWVGVLDSPRISWQTAGRSPPGDDVLACPDPSGNLCWKVRVSLEPLGHGPRLDLEHLSDPVPREQVVGPIEALRLAPGWSSHNLDTTFLELSSRGHRCRLGAGRD